jgi:hypothetical protein
MNACSAYAFNHLTLSDGEAKILLKAGLPVAWYESEFVGVWVGLEFPQTPAHLHQEHNI